VRELTIGYALEGARRGYTYLTPTDGVDPDSLKSIWRGAMPRGQGWSDEAYRNAFSLKCFALESGEAVACEVHMTDLEDEVGRRGIRQADVKIMTLKQYRAYLLQRLNALPAATVKKAEKKLYSREWELMFKKYREIQRPKTMIKPQTILAYPYKGDWTFVEACILMLATRTTLLANLLEVSPAINPFADRVFPFTTLALDYRDEGRLVALPLDRARTFDDIPYINIS
jgi:hypothetical protein